MEMPQPGDGGHGLSAGGDGTQWIVEQYIDRPLLLHGYKFDLRLYVAVTSIVPLKIYLHKEGLVRLATEKYVAPSDIEGGGAESLTHRYMHLTNYTINKRNKAFSTERVVGPDGTGLGARASSNLPTPAGAAVPSPLPVPSPRTHEGGCGGVVDSGALNSGGEHGPSSDGVGDSGGGGLASKMSLDGLRVELLKMGMGDDDLDKLWEKIESVIIKSFLSAEPAIVAGQDIFLTHPANCFQLFGFDVLIDEDLGVWVLEINFAPSMNTDSDLDLKVKGGVVS